jgi:hypothetical protein
MQSNDDRKWDDMRNAMILAMHELFLSNSEFKDQYNTLFKKHVALYRQFEGDNILNDFLKQNDADNQHT